MWILRLLFQALTVPVPVNQYARIFGFGLLPMKICQLRKEEQKVLLNFS
jgi:hypothetical protein